MSSPIDPPVDAVLPPLPDGAPGPGERTAIHPSSCFGCSDAGLGIRSWVQDDGVSVATRFDVRAEHQGAPGILHGGLLTTAFDEALGSAHSLYARPAVTARLETDFRAPVPVDRTVWLRGRVTAVAGRKLFVEATAFLDELDGTVVGAARGLFLAVGYSHFLRHGRVEDLVAAGAPAEVIEAARSGERDVGVRR